MSGRDIELVVRERAVELAQQSRQLQAEIATLNAEADEIDLRLRTVRSLMYPSPRTRFIRGFVFGAGGVPLAGLILGVVITLLSRL